MFRFYLGTHRVSQPWFDLGVPLFISRRQLTGRKTLPRAREVWALDSGGFSELSMYGEWRTTEREYVADVRRFQKMGLLLWAAPQDWMCEPVILEQTGLTLQEHQRRTVDNFLSLRQELGEGVIPVLQGWQQEDYHRCWQMYDEAGVDLANEHTVGLGTVCRRQDTREAEDIVRSLQPLRLHGFGVKMTGVAKFADALVSADSLAWSYNGRRGGRCPFGTTRKNCANCAHHALSWRRRLLELIPTEEIA